MLHPVGPLPAAVYWRRRALVLTLLLALLGGGGWLGVALLRGGSGAPEAAAADSSAAPTQAPGTPALERVVPSLASVQTPTAPSTPSIAPATPAGPQPGGPCTDDMIAVEVRAPATAPSGSSPVFELLVGNTSPVPCVRALDKELQEIVLLDGTGARLWGSNDCQPEASDDVRTLAPGEVVTFPLTWSGLTSDPTCSAPRQPLPPGQYVLRGRLDTKPGPDTPFAIV